MAAQLPGQQVEVVVVEKPLVRITVPEKISLHEIVEELRLLEGAEEGLD